MYDLQFEPFDSEADGASLAAPVVVEDIQVNDGLFSSQVDFGLGVFGSADVWLEIGVRPSASTEDFTLMVPRQKVTPTPIALHAVDVSSDAIGSLQIVDGSITAVDVDLSSIQARISDSCTGDEAIRAINSNGTVSCASAAPGPAVSYGWWSDYLLDDGNVGRYNSIIIGIDGLPIISYYDAENGDLEVFHCDNPSCASGTQSTVDSSGIVGKYTSIAIGRDGFPLVSYYDDTNGDLKLARCNNITCTSSSTQTIDAAGTVGQYTSITTTDLGYAFISYYDADGGDLKAVQCNNISCTSNTIWTVDSGGDVGRYSSVTRNPNDYAFISYYDATNGDLKVARCFNMSCGSPSINTVDGLGSTGGDEDDVGHYSSITSGRDGLPLIAYAKVPQTNSSSQMRIAHCNTPTCSSADVDTMISASTINWQGISITLGRDGLGLITAGFETTSRIYAFHCENVACSGQTISDGVVTSGAFDSAVTIGADNLPVISYSTDTDDALRVVHCSDWSCQPYLRRR